jgi:hypothetical protein
MVCDLKERFSNVALDSNAEMRKATTRDRCNASRKLQHDNERFRTLKPFKSSLSGLQLDGMRQGL